MLGRRSSQSAIRTLVAYQQRSEQHAERDRGQQRLHEPDVHQPFLEQEREQCEAELAAHADARTPGVQRLARVGDERWTTSRHHRDFSQQYVTEPVPPWKNFFW